MHIKLLSVAKVQIKPKTTSKKTKILNNNNLFRYKGAFLALFSEINRVLFRQLADCHSGSWLVIIPAVGRLSFRQLADYCSARLSTALTQVQKTGRDVRPVFLFLF